MLKVGLVGVGGISGAHIPAWEAMEDTELVAICDVRPERMDRKNFQLILSQHQWSEQSVISQL